MPTDPLKLQALAQVAIEDATQRYLDGGSLPAWERDMRAILARAHTAAYLAGVSERLGVPLDSALISERRLSRVERAEIRRVVDDQLKYFNGFVRDVDRLSPAQIAARADLYAGATRATYYETRWGDWELPFAPADGGTPCKGRCRCYADVEDIGGGAGRYHYHLGGSERHCDICPSRAASSPYTVRRRAA